MAKMSQDDIRNNVTNAISEMVQSGKFPWRKPWVNDPNAGPSTNIDSKKKYQRINTLLLAISEMRFGFKSKWWGTMKQWNKMGGKVQKRPDHVPEGQWGTSIIFYKMLNVPAVDKDKNPILDENGKQKINTIPLMRLYTVFNIDQVEDREGKSLAQYRVNENEQHDDENYDLAQSIIDNTGAVVMHGGNKAFYQPVTDTITLPTVQQFESLNRYYETAFHELAHWAEHPTRLNAEEDKKRNYAFNELVAEIASCFLSGEAGLHMSEEMLEDHAAYVQSWLKALQDDNRFIFKAASAAHKATDFIMEFSKDEEEKQAA